MIRTQVQLTERQARSLRRLAEQRGVSMAAIVRELVDRTIANVDARDDRAARARSAVGRFASGRADTSGEHDAVLGDAFGT